jgi:hypothetical protein
MSWPIVRTKFHCWAGADRATSKPNWDPITAQRGLWFDRAPNGHLPSQLLRHFRPSDDFGNVAWTIAMQTRLG